jgi:membrane-associated protease RseP (regulator of RpoE activity)
MDRYGFLSIAVAIGLIVLVVLAHELGHVFAMRRYGIRIAELGIGLPFAPKLSVACGNRFLGPEFRLVITPWLVGAYVKPEGNEDDPFQGLTFRDKTHINGAGILANFLTAAVVYACLSAEARAGWALAAACGVVFVLLVAPRFLCTWVLPVASVLVLGGVIFLIFKNPPTLEDAGMVLMVEDARGSLSSWTDTGEYVFMLSMLLGLTNLVPVFPLDGGHIWSDILSSRLPRLDLVFKVSGVLVVLGLLLFSLAGDLRRLF